jgi:hypothetical protein
MFQTFTTKMFKQRVLTAYEEKAAHGLQEKLLHEPDEEENAAAAKKARMARILRDRAVKKGCRAQ